MAPDPQPPRHRIEILYLAWLLAASGPSQGTDYQLYRCPGADGTSEFRAYPCAGDRGDALQIRDQPVGWEAPPPTPSPAEAIRAKRQKAAATSKTQDTKRQEERCWQTEQRLEQVNNKLRRGYTIPQGNRLHDQQAEYEAYLKRFCQSPSP